MTASLTFESHIHFRRGSHGAKAMQPGVEPSRPACEPGRVPRVARLMALAIHFDKMLRSGAIADHTELARLGHVTRARVSQVMNLTNLASDLQESLLFMPRTERGRDAIILRDLQPIASELDWRRQRTMWRSLAGRGPRG
jgi:hypothetical protein